MSVGPDQTTLTVKYGDGFSAPWLVLCGNPGTIRRQLLESFGSEDDPELSLIELSSNLAAEAQAAYALATGGAKPVGSSSGGRRASYNKPTQQAQPAKAEQSEEASEEDRNVTRLLAETEAADSLTALKKVWATNQAEFSDKRLQVAFTAKQKALSS